MKRTKGDVIFDWINCIILGLITFIMIYPLYLTILASISDIVAWQGGKVYIVPIGLNFEAYQNIYRDGTIWRGYMNSIIYTVIGTLYNVAMTIMCAYAMSRDNMKGKQFINLFFIFTMYFGGGMIPYYLLIKQLGWINTLWVMTLTNGMSVFNMIITRTFYRSNFSNEIYEAAKIDGAGELRIFLQMALPLSGSIIAVMSLYAGVGIWNSWFGGLLYITSPSKYPLALILRTIIIEMANFDIQVTSSALESAEEAQRQLEISRMQESMRYALIFVSSAPVLIAYPFVQKHFVKGVLIGSVKG